MSDYYRCTCGNHLEKVTQSANSMLNSEQFDAARMGDWFCRRCPKNEGKNRYFWDSEVAALAASPARIDCGEAGHSEGCCGNAQCLPSAAPAQPDTMKQSPHPEYDKGFSDGWNRCEARQAAAPAQPAAHMQMASPIFALAVRALNGVKAWRDCEGNDGFPDEVREQIDAVLSAFELRYTTHPTTGEPMGTDAQEATAWKLAAENLQRENATLRDALKKSNSQAEHFEREWYLRGDALEAFAGTAPMPDLTALTEAGAKAWAGVDPQAMRTGGKP